MKLDQTRLFEAICGICPEILLRATPIGTWRNLHEDDLWFELIACILGSQVSFEIAQRAAQSLKAQGLADSGLRANCDEYEHRLIECLVDARYRFPVMRARQVRLTQEMIYRDGGSLRSLLDVSVNSRGTRADIVARTLGVGPKQASLFLRNVGFSADLAVLDAHVLRYMAFMGLINPHSATKRSPPATITHYERSEAALRDHAAAAGYALGHMDWAIWIVMRVIAPEEMAAWT